MKFLNQNARSNLVKIHHTNKEIYVHLIKSFFYRTRFYLYKDKTRLHILIKKYDNTKRFVSIEQNGKSCDHKEWQYHRNCNITNLFCIGIELAIGIASIQHNRNPTYLFNTSPPTG